MVQILKAQSSIYFVNSERFRKQLLKYNKINENSSDLDNRHLELERFGTEKQALGSHLILDFSAVNYVDTTGIKMIVQLIQDLNKNNIFVYICQAQGLSCTQVYYLKFI